MDSWVWIHNWRTKVRYIMDHHDRSLDRLTDEWRSWKNYQKDMVDAKRIMETRRCNMVVFKKRRFTVTGNCSWTLSRWFLWIFIICVNIRFTYYTDKVELWGSPDLALDTMRPCKKRSMAKMIPQNNAEFSNLYWTLGEPTHPGIIFKHGLHRQHPQRPEKQQGHVFLCTLGQARRQCQSRWDIIGGKILGNRRNLPRKIGLCEFRFAAKWPEMMSSNIGLI